MEIDVTNDVVRFTPTEARLIGTFASDATLRRHVAQARRRALTMQFPETFSEEYFTDVPLDETDIVGSDGRVARFVTEQEMLQAEGTMRPNLDGSERSSIEVRLSAKERDGLYGEVLSIRDARQESLERNRLRRIGRELLRDLNTANGALSALEAAH